MMEILRFENDQRLADNVSSAIEIGMHQTNEFFFNNDTSLILYHDTLNKVNITKKHWGVYQVISAWALWKEDTVGKTALFGSSFGGPSAIGVYLADHGIYLAVSGDTRLTGTSYLPKLGVRKSYIEGKSFLQKKITNGPVKNSKDSLPVLNANMRKYWKKDLFELKGNNDTIVGENYLDKKELTNSFMNKTIRILSENEISLSGLTLSGNIIVQSDKRIFIAMDCSLNNVLCVAPDIYVEKGFEGKVQLFALDTVIVNPEVHLQYPSAVVTAGFGSTSAYLEIGKDCDIEGSVIAFSDAKINSSVSISLKQGSEIYGIVYCRGKVQERAKVFGSLYCDKFFLYGHQGYYEDQLLDAWIDPIHLEPHFVSGILFSNAWQHSQYRVIAWLN